MATLMGISKVLEDKTTSADPLLASDPNMEVKSYVVLRFLQPIPG
jgi:hypothetical protein